MLLVGHIPPTTCLLQSFSSQPNTPGLTLVWSSFSSSTPAPQEKATKWKNPDGHMDGLTTNGVLVMHPEGFPEDSRQGLWREISVCGDVYALRETRSGPSRGKLVSTSCRAV